MARRVDLIDQFTELVVGADDPRRLAERTLEVVMSLLTGRAAAVFPISSREPLYAPERASDRRLPAATAQRPGPASLALVPVLEDEALIALLYVDSQEP